MTAVTVVSAGLTACGEESGGANVPDGGEVLGTVDDLRSAVRDAGGVWRRDGLRAYLVEVPAEHRSALAAALDPQLRSAVEDAGLLALSEKCPHQGCRVPECERSGWFECPCHGSRYTPYGELRRGPAERGMSYLPLVLEGDDVRLLPGSIEGLDEGVDVTGVADPGAHCY